MSNSVPEGWYQSKLGVVADLIMGQSPPSNTYNNSRIGLPFFQGKTDFGSHYPSVRVWCSKPTKVAEKDSILFSVRAPVGDINIASESCCIGRGLAAIKGTKVEQAFLYQTFKFVKHRFQLLAQGSTFEAVSGGEMRDFKLILPPLPEQKKIAAILTSVDTVIEKTQAQIDKLKDLKTGMMQELLTKGIGHTEFKDSPVGWIPVEWEVDSIESFGISILDGDRGKEYPKEKDFFQNEYCLFLSAKNVTKHGFKFNETVYITKKKDDLLRKGKLIRNDIVITTRGTVGNIALYDDSISYNHIRINSGMAIIRNQEDKLDTEYLNLVLHSPLVCEQIELLAFGSAQPQLTIGLIKNLFIPKPDIEEQNKISKSIGSIQEKISIVESKLKSLQNTKKALMQDLLTGKVRLKV